MNSGPFSIAIIGAGFSGALLAVQLLRRCREDDRVYLIEKRAGFGRGLAYSTSNVNHLLNVRAGNMSAFHGSARSLRRVAAPPAPARRGRPMPMPDANSFVSRRLYGTYVRSLLCDELWQSGKGRNLFLVPDQAVALNVEPGGVFLTVAGGRCYRVDIVVLAAGNLPPDESRGAYFGNPWHPDATAGIGRDDKVLLIGSGLTMVDTVQTLLEAGHRGPIQALSRRGLVPHVHVPTDPLAISAFDLPRTTSVARLARWLRARVRCGRSRGSDLARRDRRPASASAGPVAAAVGRGTPPLSAPSSSVVGHPPPSHGAVGRSHAACRHRPRAAGDRAWPDRRDRTRRGVGDRALAAPRRQRRRDHGGGPRHQLLRARRPTTPPAAIR